MGFQGKDRNADVRRTERLVVAAETKKMSRLAKDGLLTSHMIKLLEYGGSTPSPLPPLVKVHLRLVASSRTQEERKDDKKWHGQVGSRRPLALSKWRCNCIYSAVGDGAARVLQRVGQWVKSCHGAMVPSSLSFLPRVFPWA